MTHIHLTKQNGEFTTPDHIERYLEMIRTLPDGNHTVTVKKKTQKRSLHASALLHVWIKVFADHIGEPSVERCKTDVKRHILGVKERESKITGKVTAEDYKTSEMTTAELSDFMSKFKIWALCVFDCRLPFWREDGYEQMIEQYGH